MRQNTSVAGPPSVSAMARPAFARSVPQDCFLPEYCSPFVRVMAKQCQSAVREGPGMCAPQPNRRTKARAMCPALLQASLLVTQLVSLEANSRVIRRRLLQENSRVKLLVTAGWIPPLLEPRD